MNQYLDREHFWDVRECMEFGGHLDMPNRLVQRGAFWMFIFNVLTAVALAAENVRGVDAVKYARYW